MRTVTFTGPTLRVQLLALDAKMEARHKRRDLEKAAQVDKLTDTELEAIIALGGVRTMIEKLTNTETKK